MNDPSDPSEGKRGSSLSSFFCCSRTSRSDEGVLASYDDVDEAFSYSNICDRRVDEYSGEDTDGLTWAATVDDDGHFIYLKHEPAGNLVERVRISGAQSGWKFHISLSEASDNIQKAWDSVIMPAIIRHKIYKVKIVTPTNKQNGDRQAGKQVTIYAKANPVDEYTNVGKWQAFLTDISQGLIRNNTTPGPHAKVFAGGSDDHYLCDEPPVGPYVTYRNDENERGNYTDSPTGYKPEGADDPFDGMTLDLEDAEDITPEAHPLGERLSTTSHSLSNSSSD